MARIIVDFIHMDVEYRAGDELPDDHPLVSAGPHLFEQPPEPEPAPAEEPVRIRGPLVNPTSSKPSRKGK